MKDIVKDANQEEHVERHWKGDVMGYRVKRIQALEEENKKLKEEKEFWRREAIHSKSELGEMKMKLQGLISNYEEDKK